MSRKILIVDDEDLIRDSLLDILSENKNYKLFVAKSGEKAQDILQQESIHVMITDVKMEGISGLELLQWTRENSPLTETIVITAYASVKSAVNAMKEGAFNYLSKPFSAETVKAEIKRALEHRELKARNKVLQAQIDSRKGSKKLIGASEAMDKIHDKIKAVSSTNVSVLIRGETGTGKELLAQKIHENSRQAEGNFVVVDCGTLPENIMESELFGHKRGAFTGAHETKPGKFELADEGTLFLDEIGNLPPHMQTKLLRFLQTHKFTPLGSTKSRKVDTRVLAATNIDIENEIQTGNFREDLYYRLNVMTIEMPALRKRPEDIEALSKEFLQRFAPDIKPEVNSIEPKAMEALYNYNWPGNVRELENCIKYALAMASEKELSVKSLPPYIFSEQETSNSGEANKKKKSLEQIEKEHILRVIEDQNWNISAATRILGINRSTIYNKIEKYKLKQYQPDA